MAANPLDNGGRRKSYSTGTPGASSLSPRPKRTAQPDDLDSGGRRRSFSNGTQIVAGANTRSASAPSPGPVPRGYVHNEPSYQPSTRSTSRNRLKKGLS